MRRCEVTLDEEIVEEFKGKVFANITYKFAPGVTVCLVEPRLWCFADFVAVFRHKEVFNEFLKEKYPEAFL